MIDAQEKSIKSYSTIIDSLNVVLNDKIVKITVNDDSLYSNFCGFCGKLKELMISGETLVFVTGCALMGLVIITADWLSFAVSGKGERSKSILSLKYAERNKIILNYLLWGIGSAIFAYITYGLGMVQCSFISCATIAIGWPTLLPRIIKKLGEQDDELQQL